MIALLNPVFNCSNNLLLFSADKVTTGTYNFVYFILKVALVGESSRTSGLSPCATVTNLFSKLVITQFADQLKVKDTSQLINGISSVLQKLPKYFNGTAISTSLVLFLFTL